MAYHYQLLKPKRPLTSATEVLAENLDPLTTAEVRFALETALHGVRWDAWPPPGTAIRGFYDGPGGWIELALGEGHAEIVSVRTANGKKTARLVRSLCDRTGWTALDLETLAIFAPRPVAEFRLTG